MTNTKRLFVAIPLLESFTKDLLPILKKLKIGADSREMEIQWPPTENFHITLNFLGDTPLAQIPELESSLSAIAGSQMPFQLKIENCGAFPDEYHGRTLWMGVQKKKDLVALQNCISDALVALGFSTEDREYTPHITFGKLRKSRQVRDLLSPYVRKKFGVLKVSKISLFESIKTHRHSIYRPIKDFDFNLI